MIYKIQGYLATLNDHDASNRSNKFAGAALKKEMTHFVAMQLLNKKPINKPCIITINWKVSSNHDFDNISFAKKYILDGMVKSKILPDDNQKWVLGFGGDWFTKVHKGQEEIIIEVEEIDNE